MSSFGLAILAISALLPNFESGLGLGSGLGLSQRCLADTPSRPPICLILRAAYLLNAPSSTSCDGGTYSL